MLLVISKLQTYDHLHQWKLVTGKGYDYDSDYYQCKKCGLKVARFFGDRELQNEDFPVSTFLP